MGSEIIETLTIQKGNVETDSEFSQPITQQAQDFTTSSEPIQQRFRARTSPLGHLDAFNSHSKPISQLGPFKFAPDFPDVGKQQSIVQEILVTANHPRSISDIKPDTPIQQRLFTGDTESIQQFIIKSSSSSNSRPIQQEPVIQNTINITQFDFLDLVFPPCFSSKNAVNTNILWRIRDFGLPLDAETLIFKVDGIEIQDTSDFTLTSLSNGLQLFYDPPTNFLYDTEVRVVLTIDDTAEPPNTFFVNCPWQTVPDVRPPFFRSISPACNSTNVSAVSPVSFDVLDFGAGIDPDSVRLSIEGITVCSGLVLEAITDQDFTTISGIPVGAEVTGFHVTYEHPNDPWRFGSNVTIALEARDISPLKNRVLFVCAFDIEDSVEPMFINIEPEPCDSFVDNRTGLYFEVYGVEHGVDISTLEVRVDNKLRKVFVRPRILRSE